MKEESLKRLVWVTRLLDDRFRIPGTSIRFGLDALLGLAPFAGDMVGLGLSGLMFHAMWRHGAGPLLLLRMLGNVLLDALVGIVPVVGDVFDVAFKANRRNLTMLTKYYHDNPERPSLGFGLVVVGLLFLGLFIALIWGVVWLLSWLWSGLF
jgi:hypothetical protein